MKKVLYIGKMPENGYPIFAEVCYNGERLVIHAVEGPLKSGNCKGSVGQCRETLLSAIPEGDLTKDQMKKLYNIWNEWHLNDMTAGSPAQMAFLKDNKINGYEEKIKALTEAGLNPDQEYIHNDKPYEYGTAWLKTEVPTSVIEWLESLPTTSRTPNWI